MNAVHIGVSMVRTKRGERTVAEILEAGRSVLLDRGPEQLSLREVARRADLSPSALYNHFRDRDELVAAVAMGSVGTLATYLEAAPDGPAPMRLRSLGLAYACFADEHPEEYRVIFDCLVNPPRSWESYLEVAHPFSIIVATCAQGLSEGTFVDTSGNGPGGLAYALWALVDGHVHLRAKHLSAIEGPYNGMFVAGLEALLAGFAPTDPSRAQEKNS